VTCFAGCSTAEIDRAIKALPEVPTSAHLPAGLPRPPVSREALTEAAARIWQEAAPIAGTIVETYLRQTRRISVPLPDTLRCHAGLFHKSSGLRFPAMVALITDVDDNPIAVHRTWIDPTTADKAAVSPNRMVLATAAGGAIRLAPVDAGRELALAEGVETALAVIELFGSTTWSGISASLLQLVQLPASARRVVIAADADRAGLAAAHALRRRLQGQGRTVRVIAPCDDNKDFNDTLKGRLTS
jgi:hypothetical protein